jgi:hypothetical protein
MKSLFCFILPALLILGACTSSTTPQADGEGTQQGKRGNFAILVTDAPLEADQVLVNYKEVAVHRTGAGFETIWTGTKTMDLIALRDKEELLLDAPLTAGFYTQIRFIIDSGQVVVDRVPHPLEVPSAEVKVVANFQVQEGGTTRLVLDFDAEKSIHLTGAGKSPNTKYILRPVIKVKSITS